MLTLHRATVAGRVVATLSATATVTTSGSRSIVTVSLDAQTFGPLSSTAGLRRATFSATARCSVPASMFGVGASMTQRRFNRPPSYSEITQALGTLKVDINVKGADLKKEYLNLVRANHPDKGGSEDKMKEITTSYMLLKGLSSSDRKSFIASRDSYSPGAARRADAQGRTRPNNYNNPHDAHEAYRRKYDQQQKGYYKYDPNTGNYTNTEYHTRQNPFTYTGKMGMGPTMSSARRVAPNNMLFRFMFAYMIASFMTLIMMRMYRDYTNDYGWAESQAAAKSERLENLARMRQGQAEWLERRRQDTYRSREQRAMDYAQRREREMVSADHGSFPRLNPEGLEGLIMRDYNDPPGISFYVPPLPNGAPPFSGNGRFQYSTGSIARNQCVPTKREQPKAAVTQRNFAPTAKPGSQPAGGPQSIGDLAADSANRGSPSSERRVYPQDSAAYRKQQLSNPAPRPASPTAVVRGATTGDGEPAPQPLRKPTPIEPPVPVPIVAAEKIPEVKPGDPTELPPAKPLETDETRGFYGDDSGVQKEYTNDRRPQNMRRRPYLQPLATIEGSTGVDTRIRREGPPPGSAIIQPVNYVGGDGGDANTTGASA